MMMKRITNCPACNNMLHVATLRCENCGLELHNNFETSPFEKLNTEQYDFLISFLKNRGNMKLVQSELNISYPYAKKKMDDLLVQLELSNEKSEGKNEMRNIELVDENNWRTDSSSVKASDIIKCALKKNKGRAVIRSLEDNEYEIFALKDGETFLFDVLPLLPFSYSIFDVVVDYLVSCGGRAAKGNGRNYKIGEEKCDENTIAGIIGTRYYNKSYGESMTDPVFLVAAALNWSGIVHNKRGYLELTKEYKNLIDMKR